MRKPRTNEDGNTAGEKNPESPRYCPGADGLGCCRANTPPEFYSAIANCDKEKQFEAAQKFADEISQLPPEPFNASQAVFPATAAVRDALNFQLLQFKKGEDTTLEKFKKVLRFAQAQKALFLSLIYWKK